MSYKVKRLSSESLGTHYGLFVNETLIHYEFSRSAAEKVLKAIESGSPLYDVLFDQINHFCSLKFREELDTANKEIKKLKLELEIHKKNTDKAKEVESLISNKPQGVKIEFDPLSIIELSKKHPLSKVEIQELSLLVKEMKAMSFKYSSELSNYIKNNSLGSKYPNIAGIVTMQNSSDTWKFKGGFPRNIYRIVCQELNLVDKGTSAKAIDFLSYKQLGV